MFEVGRESYLSPVRPISSASLQLQGVVLQLNPDGALLCAGDLGYDEDAVSLIEDVHDWFYRLRHEWH